MITFIKNLSIAKKLAAVAGLLGVIALFIGNVSSTKISVNAKDIALSTLKDNDKISILQLADWLIKDKGDFTLVDLRSEKEFNEYSIPNAVNIKMDELLNSELRRNEKILLYGSDDIASAQAWFILKSAGYKGSYILKGGMDGWKNQVLNPVYILGSSSEDSLKFETIKQISMHFGGSPKIVSSSGTTTNVAATENKTPTVSAPKLNAPKSSIVKKKKEGC